MASRLRSTLLRLLKPLVAGIGLAYLVTAFVDKPAQVHFQPENPYASKQEEIVESHASLVMEKNIMKLGSPLSVTPDGGMVENNPLAALEELETEEIPTYSGRSANDNATEVRAEVNELPVLEEPSVIEELSGPDELPSPDEPTGQPAQ